MGLLGRLSEWLGTPGPPPMFAPEDQRAFVPGAAVVAESDRVWGHDNQTYGPSEYGTYVATSNGIYVCARMRAQLLASLPLKLHRLKRNGDKSEVTSGPLFELLQKVNPFWTFARLVEMTELSLCLWGQAFWLLERGQSGRQVPREIWWARPDRIKVVPHPNDYVAGYLYQPLNGGKDIPYTRNEVIWLRYPNPLDEYSGLSPLAAARIAADTASAAMHSNRNIFANGVQMAGVIGPPQGQNLTEDQARSIEETFARRFKGVDKAHRVAVLRYESKFQQVSMSPKDAEFLGSLRWSLEEIARAYGVPIDLLGGDQRTYANVRDARHAIWTQTIQPEATFFGSELTEQLLPMFPREADLAAFDLSEVDVLHEDEAAKWQRHREMIETGYRTRNDILTGEGLAPVPWGDDWWAPITLAPIGGPMAAQAEQDAQDAAELAAKHITQGPEPIPPEEEGATTETPRSRRVRAVAYGSVEHERAWRRAVARTDPWERAIGEVTVGLVRRQRQSIVAQLRETERAMVAGGQRLTAGSLLESIFGLPKWIREFRVAMRRVLASAYAALGQAALDEIGAEQSFDAGSQAVIRAVERQAQEFATAVNATTYRQLEATLAEGLAAGEATGDLVARVETVMVGRTQDAEGVIAATEAGRADTAAGLEAARQSGVVVGKTWNSQLDDRVRETHRDAHGQTVGIDDSFRVGAASGPGPRMMGAIEEDARCRCFVEWVKDTDAQPPRALNGHDPWTTTLAQLARVAGVEG